MEQAQAWTTSEEANALVASIRFTPIATVVTDPSLPDNPIIAANPAFMQLTGYSLREIIGRNCRFLAGPDTEPASQSVLREAVARPVPALVELLNYRKDGSAFRNAVMIAPVFGDDGRPRFFIGSQMEVGQVGAGLEARRARAELAVGQLTGRQRQVLERVARGYRNKQIAAELGIGEKTVKMHRAAMLVRLGVATSADAIRIGIEAGLVG